MPDNTSEMESQIQTQPKGGKKAASKPLSESDDVRARNKPPSRFGSVVRQEKTTAVRAEKVTRENALFLDSDEENHEVNTIDIDEGVDEEQTLQSSFETRQTVGRRSMRETKCRKPAAIIADDDSDDDAVFKGFKGRR